MSKKTILLPKQQRLLQVLGENLKLARLRRKLSMEMVAERANISRTTLWKIEKGEADTSLAILLRVLSAYGIGKDILKLANDDTLGRKLQDLDILVKKRAPK
jgi:transcriptional regulator with XRE-family HTH domain